MQFINEYIGLERTKVLVEDYDNKVLIPMLVKVYHFLNVKHRFAPTLNRIVPNDSMFEVHDSYEKTSEGLLRSEISLYFHNDASIEDMIFFYYGGKNTKNKMLGFWSNRSWAFLA
jgi:hypothetical protein